MQRVNEIINTNIQALRNINLNQDWDGCVEFIDSTEGKLLTTGIGKAGHIAKKCAATFCSTAMPCVFVHPSEAVHGDLGIVSPDDCLIAFSTSGKSDEVIKMISLAKKIGLKKIIGITSHPDSKLRELSSIIIDMGEINESCRLGLTPTASIVVMLTISDILALLCSEQKGIEIKDFQARHHGGYLGNK